MPLKRNQRFHFLKSKKLWVSVGLWLVLAGIGVHIRLMPLITFASHDSMEKASLLLVNDFRRKIKVQVEQNLPTLPAVHKEQLIQKKINELLHENAEQVRRTIASLARRLDHENNTAQRRPYLLASDSFYYLRQTQKIIEQGVISSKMKGSKYHNEMMLAPEGHWEPLNLHPYLGAWLYRTWSAFEPDVELSHAVAFTPLVILVLSLAAFLMVCHLLKCNPLSSLLGGMYFVTAPILVKRSCYGWYDNDPYNVLFPLLILAVLFYGLQNRHDLKRMITASIISMFFFALYALFWHGWMFLLGILFASGILIILYDQFAQHEKKATRNLLIFYALIPAAALLGITLVFGIKEFFILISEGWQAVNDFFKPQLSLWPNLYIGVGELHGASLAKIIDLTGGPAAFALAGLGLVIYLFPALAGQSFRNLYPFAVIAVFLPCALYLTLGAERFALLLLIPVTLLITLGMDILSRSAMESCRARMTTYTRRVLLSGFMLVFIAVLFVLPIRAAYQKWPHLINRIYNDTWHTVLTRIRATTPLNSIINTWWSPGHFITAVAQRRVTFDGASINKPQAYWMARVLTSTDERQALGWLRMLNNCGNQAIDLLTECGLSLPEAVKLLEKITPLARARAEHVLAMETRLNADQKQSLLSMIFQEPPPSYLLIYNELIENNIQLSFVARWDFQRIEKIAQDPEARAKLLGSPRDYVHQIWEMQGGQPKFSGIIKASYQNDMVVLFGDQIRVDLNQMTCRIDSDQFGRGIPYSLMYAEGQTIREKKLKNFSLPYSIVLYQRNDHFQCVLMDNALAHSLLMRLFFFEGRGLRYLRPVIQEADLTLRTQIYVFQVNWGKFLKDIRGL